MVGHRQGRYRISASVRKLLLLSTHWRGVPRPRPEAVSREDGSPASGPRSHTMNIWRTTARQCSSTLEKDTPVSRAVERPGHILCRPVLGGHFPFFPLARASLGGGYCGCKIRQGRL